MANFYQRHGRRRSGPGDLQALRRREFGSELAESVHGEQTGRRAGPADRLRQRTVWPRRCSIWPASSTGRRRAIWRCSTTAARSLCGRNWRSGPAAARRHLDRPETSRSRASPILTADPGKFALCVVGAAARRRQISTSLGRIDEAIAQLQAMAATAAGSGQRRDPARRSVARPEALCRGGRRL